MNKNNNEIYIENLNELEVDDLIYALDNSSRYSVYEICNNDQDNEKNIIIKIFK